MIQAKFELEWLGEKIAAKLNRELQREVLKSGEKVRDETKKLLNESGKGVVAKTGLNQPGKGSSKMTTTQKSQAVYQNGLKNIQNLKTITSAKAGKTLHVGGSYKGVDRIYYYGEPLHRWVQSSLPGSPPHKQHGTLQRSISVEPMNGNMRVKVGPAHGLKYARIQELGGRGMIRLPARPYLKPAFESQQNQIFDRIREAIKRAFS